MDARYYERTTLLDEGNVTNRCRVDNVVNGLLIVMSAIRYPPDFAVRLLAILRHDSRKRSPFETPLTPP